jgi:beta-N-acetylhexosaminidase
MGFDGAVVTDALDMDGVAEGRGIAGVAAAAVRALHAGADLLCLGSNFDDAMTSAVIDAVVPAVAGGAIPREQLELSHKRIASLRAGRPVSPVAAGDAAHVIAARAIELVGALPPGPYAVLECRPRLSMASFNVSWGIAAEVGERGWPTMRIEEADDVDATCAAFVEAAGDRAIIVVVRDTSVHQWQREVIDHCVSSGHATVVVEMGWSDSWRPASDAYVVSHGASRSSARAVIDLLKDELSPLETTEEN